MKNTLSIIVPLLAVLALMEGVVWLVLKSSKDSSVVSQEEERPRADQQSTVEAKQEELKEELVISAETPAPYSGMGNTDSASFPPPTTEVKNGKTERTIHMGVRQYVWEPATITAKKGELVRLIIHNADVLHGLVIPDLGVNQDIPPEGAVVEFIPTKTGTFEFFCSVWCGEGHMEMQGKITIE